MVPWLAYRLGLGWLLGHRVVLLEHRGRTTGRPVRTVLHVVRWDPASRHMLVAVGSSPGTDWYRNVLAHPLVRVTIGRERNVVGCAVPLPDDEARSELERARARRPGFARRAVQALLAPFGRRAAPAPDGPAVMIDLAPPRRRIHRSHRSQRRPLAA
jgi:deazaflavin-dependent oxidoreductase (nitroreductase family)